MIFPRFCRSFHSSDFLKGVLSERKITLLEVGCAVNHWPPREGGSDGFSVKTLQRSWHIPSPSSYTRGTSEGPYIGRNGKLLCRQPERCDACTQLLLLRPSSWPSSVQKASEWPFVFQCLIRGKKKKGGRCVLSQVCCCFQMNFTRGRTVCVLPAPRGYPWRQ